MQLVQMFIVFDWIGSGAPLGVVLFWAGHVT
jgi:hypothetical protein